MGTPDLNLLLNTLESVLESVPRPISLHEPTFCGNEWKYTKECIDTGWVSSVGAFVNRFSSDLAQYTGVKHAIPVVNGTAALHASLVLLGSGPQDEVLVPALTFIGTVNAISYTGATPHFVDSEEISLGVDAKKLDTYLEKLVQKTNEGPRNSKTGRRIRALIVMHAFGHPADLDALVAVCQKYGIELIEDAAESIGSFYKGRHTGNWGKLSILSFNGNKTITTGGGGAILTQDDELAKRARHLTTTAKIPHQWEFVHDEVGYNYRMPNLNAAMGCAQLEELNLFLEKKREVAKKYQKAFQGMPGFKFLAEPSYAKSNYWLNAIVLDQANLSVRNEILKLTNSKGIMTRPVWQLMNHLAMFKDCPKMDLSVAESLEQRLINLPSSSHLFGSFKVGAQ